MIPAYAARGARTVRKGGKTVGGNGTRLAAATISATAALLADAKATALVCAGKLEAEPKAQEDFRSAFRFAARHKLPILYLVANTLTPGRKQELDLRTLYAEFGIPVFSVDANDAIAAYRVATEALHNARHQRGPCVIEALTLLGKDGCPRHSAERAVVGDPPWSCCAAIWNGTGTGHGRSWPMVAAAAFQIFTFRNKTSAANYCLIVAWFVQSQSALYLSR